MRDLTDEYKLSARSTPEVFLVLGQMANRLQAERRLRFRGKKPTRAAIVNAALLYLDSLPQAQWEAALQLGLARLEEFLAQDDLPAAAPAAPEVAPAPPEAAPAPAPTAPKAPAPKAPDRRVDLRVEDVSPEAAPVKPAPRRRKRG